MRADFGGFSYPGTVVEFCAPWFRVVFSDGDSADYTGFELAPLLDFSENDFYDPRLWFYDFSVIHPMEIPAFRRACLTYVEGFGLDLPPTWCNAAGGAGTPRRHKVASEHDDTADYIAAEEEHLADLTQRFLGGARAPRTYGNLRNPGLKLIWFQASRGRSLPPSSREATAYFTKVAEASDTVGGVALAKSALGVLCSFNELPTAIYTSMRVNAALESMRRTHRRQARKAAGLTVNMVGAILIGFCFVRPNRPPTHQWELMVGVSVGLGFKLLLRYDDLKRCRWDEGYCEVFVTHIRFYLDGRKNNQYGGNFLDVARPEVPSVFGVYHACLRALATFGRGFVLGSVDSAGVVNLDACMSHKEFVAHLREALVNIGLTREMAGVYSAHSMRAGGATAAAVHGLHREEIQHLAGVEDPNWLAYYNRNYLAERIRVSQAIGL